MSYKNTKLHREITIDSIITLHYFEYMKDFIFRGETHDFWEFLYVDKGTVSVCAGDQWHTLDAGEIIFHKPNEFHAIESIGKNSPNLVCVSFTTSSPAVNFFAEKSFLLNKEERYYISQLIAEARNTFSTPIHLPSIEQVQLRDDAPFASQQLILLYLELFLISLYRSHASIAFKQAFHPVDAIAQPLKESNARNTLFQEILHFMEFHICESLSVSDICNNFPISRSSLQALFHENLGCGIIEHFNNMKIQRAKEIIRSGTMNLTETAYFLSYSSLPHFSKQFKKITGMSPTQYANSVKGITESLIQVLPSGKAH